MTRCPADLTPETQATVNEARALADDIRSMTDRLVDALDRIEDYTHQTAGDPRDH